MPHLCINKYHKPNGLEQHSSQGQKFKMKVLADWFLLRLWGERVHASPPASVVASNPWCT